MLQVVLFFIIIIVGLIYSSMKIGFISINRNYFTSFFQNFRVFSVSSVPLSCRFFITIDTSHEKIAGCGSLFVRLVHDSREFRRNEGSSITIGKTDDSNILWYAEPFFLDSIEGGISDNIVKGEDGIRSVLLSRRRRVAFRATSKSILSQTTRSRSIGMRFSLRASR